jgi:hypothetical protein
VIKAGALPGTRVECKPCGTVTIVLGEPATPSAANKSGNEWDNIA